MHLRDWEVLQRTLSGECIFKAFPRTLKMEAIGSSEKTVSCQTKRRHIRHDATDVRTSNFASQNS
jgi:hypothetical protein